MKYFLLKFKNQTTLWQLLKRDDRGVTPDRFQASCLIKVNPSLASYVALTFAEDYFVFQGMPFGFVDAPPLSTQIMHKKTGYMKKQWQVRKDAHYNDLVKGSD